MAEVSILQKTAMDGDRLSNVRRDQIEFILKEMRVFQRRAHSPEEKIALAEIEHEILEMRKRWEEEGLINGQGQLPLLAEASRRG